MSSLLCEVFGAEELAQTLSTSEFILDDASQPPSPEARWQAQALPDNWNLSRPDRGGVGWYRLRLELPSQPAEVQAIYVAKLSMNAALYVNGALLDSGGRFEEPVARHWNRPLLFAVPPTLLRPGSNVIHVRLWAYPNSRAGLGPIVFGPEAELRPRYERRYFVQTLLPQLCNIVVAALGAFAFVLWLRRRTDPTYVLFFVFTLLWVVRSTHLIVRDIPVSAFVWDIWVLSSFGWCAVLFITIAMRYCGLRWGRVEWALLIYAALGPICMYLGGPARLNTIGNNWCFVIVPVAIFFEIFLIREALRRKTIADALLSLVWGLVVVASVHDGLVHRDKLAFDSFYFVSYVMILLSWVMGWILTNRFVQALTIAEKLNLELEIRVAEKHQELEQNFARLKHLERERAIAEERERLMSDMHDGLGSQLISSLHLAERGDAAHHEIAEAIRECLESLRLTIHSLERIDDDLTCVLAGFRYRVETRLCNRGIRLLWQVGELPGLASLTPENVLHVLRILQEAFTNIVRHAQASAITVRTRCTGEQIMIEISDNGVGVRAQNAGRGIANMHKRARALGGRVDVISSPAGTTVTLSIPRDTECRPDSSTSGERKVESGAALVAA